MHPSSGQIVIRTARDAVDFFAPLLRCPDERLIVAHLDGEGHVLHVCETSGDAATVVLPMRQIVRQALDAGAEAIILAHNHPSGDPTPSEQDKANTRRLAEVAAALDLVLHDHLIFGGNTCRSLRALGLL